MEFETSLASPLPQPMVATVLSLSMRVQCLKFSLILIPARETGTDR